MRSQTLRKEKKMRRNNIIIGVILLSVMIFSMFAYYFSSANNNVNPNLQYNGYTFTIENVKGGQMVSTSINNKKYLFYTLPQDSKSIMENMTGVNVISASPKIIFVNEPLGLNEQASSDQLYFGTLVRDLQSYSGKQIISGVTISDPLSEKLVYTCDNATATSPVVIFKKGTYTQMNITQNSTDCFEVTSDAMSLLTLRDYLIYKSLNIIV
jgi:hypothetical protein